MKILLTGSTGFIGKRLSLKLFERNHSLVALTRNPKKAAAASEIPCIFQKWDPASQSLPSYLFEEIDAVIHLAGESIASGRWTSDRKREIHRSRVQTSASIREAIASLPGKKPKVWISASAIGIYGNRGDELLTEHSPPGTGFLADVCRDWEDQTIASPIEGVRQIAVRIGIVLGREGGALQKMLPLFEKGLGGPLGNGKQWMSWIHIEDLTEAFCFLLEHQTANGPFNAVSPHPVANEEFTRSLANAVQRPARFRAPALILKSALGEMSSMVLEGQKVIPEKLNELDFQFKFPEIDSALSEICSHLPDEQFESYQFVPKPLEEVFSFFSKAENLEAITPPWLNFHIVNQSTPQMKKGTLINYKLKIHGVPVQWKSRIDSWVPNQEFSDTQVRGPYAKWEHTHRFQPVTGGTLIRDRVLFRLPAATLSQPLMGKFIRNDIQKIFDFRRSKIKEIFQK
jgi:uncharacterized protein